MSDLFEEYKAYYMARAERYANNTSYRNTYQAEKNLCDAFLSCSQPEEFRTKISNLNQKCASALTKDKFLMEQAFYKEMEEVIRIKAAERILAKVDDISEVMQLSTMVTEELNKNNIEISMDEAHRQFQHDWFMLDLVEIYENAVVPEEYKQYMQETVDSYRKSIIENMTRLEENNSHWEKGWKLRPEINLEHRHRQHLPYKDEDVTEMLNKYKTIINR